MNQMNDILKAFDEALEASSRWPRLLKALDLGPTNVTPHLVNEALKRHGFAKALDEGAAPGSSDDAWFAVAERVVGRRDASVDEVIARLRVQRP